MQYLNITWLDGGWGMGGFLSTHAVLVLLLVDLLVRFESFLPLLLWLLSLRLKLP